MHHFFHSNVSYGIVASTLIYFYFLQSPLFFINIALQHLKALLHILRVEHTHFQLLHVIGHDISRFIEKIITIQRDDHALMIRKQIFPQIDRMV